MSKKTYELKEPTPSGSTFASDTVDLSKFKRLSRPPFVHQMELPVGSVFAGKILGIHDSKIDGKTTRAFLMRRDDGTDHLFPINGVILSALGDKPEKFVDKKIAFRVLPQKKGKFKKNYFNCEVFVQ